LFFFTLQITNYKKKNWNEEIFLHNKILIFSTKQIFLISF